jgi:S1-C subfamily serine protease
MKKYNKFVIILLVAAFFIPQIAFAAWWNPFSWNIWNKKTDSQTQILEKRIRDLEDRLNNQPVISENNKKSDTPEKIVSTPTIAPIVNTDKIQQGALTNDQIIQKVKPAVVYIETNSGSGSGFIIDSNGYILTNNHVVDGAEYIKITLSDGRTFYPAKTAIDKSLDVAMLKINATGLPFLILGSSDENNLKQGDSVFTFGYPFGIEGDVSFKEGTLSRRLTYAERKWLEVSAEIHPGNSGGPLIDETGKVVGINTAIKGSATLFGAMLGETIKFSIPVNDVKNYVPALKAGKHASEIYFTKINESYEFDLTNKGPDEINIDHLVFSLPYDKKTSSSDPFLANSNSGAFSFRRMGDGDWITNYKILKGTTLLPGKSIRIYLRKMDFMFTGVVYELGSIMDTKTGNNVVFDSLKF